MMVPISCRSRSLDNTRGFANSVGTHGQHWGLRLTAQAPTRGPSHNLGVSCSCSYRGRKSPTSTPTAEELGCGLFERVWLTEAFPLPQASQCLLHVVHRLERTGRQKQPGACLLIRLLPASSKGDDIPHPILSLVVRPILDSEKYCETTCGGKTYITNCQEFSITGNYNRHVTPN